MPKPSLLELSSRGAPFLLLLALTLNSLGSATHAQSLRLQTQNPFSKIQIEGNSPTTPTATWEWTDPRLKYPWVDRAAPLCALRGSGDSSGDLAFPLADLLRAGHNEPFLQRAAAGAREYVSEFIEGNPPLTFVYNGSRGNLVGCRVFRREQIAWRGLIVEFDVQFPSINAEANQILAAAPHSRDSHFWTDPSWELLVYYVRNSVSAQSSREFSVQFEWLGKTREYERVLSTTRKAPLHAGSDLIDQFIRKNLLKGDEEGEAEALWQRLEGLTYELPWPNDKYSDFLYPFYRGLALVNLTESQKEQLHRKIASGSADASLVAGMRGDVTAYPRCLAAMRELGDSLTLSDPESAWARAAAGWALLMLNGEKGAEDVLSELSRRPDPYLARLCAYVGNDRADSAKAALQAVLDDPRSERPGNAGLTTGFGSNASAKLGGLVLRLELATSIMLLTNKPMEPAEFLLWSLE